MQKVTTKNTGVVHFGRKATYGKINLLCQGFSPRAVVSGYWASYTEPLTCKRCWARVHNARMALVALGIPIDTYIEVLENQSMYCGVKPYLDILDIKPEPF